MDTFDFLIALMTIICMTWLIIHVYNNSKKLKPLKDADNQISWIFAGGGLK